MSEDPWLPLPVVAERLGTDVGKVRRMVQDKILIAVRRGERNVWSVHEDLILDGEPLPDLRGTLILLSDAGYADEEAIDWLFTPDETIPGTPVAALRAGHKTEIRRRAQALAF